MGKQWWDFSLFGTGTAAGIDGGTAILPDDAFMRLQNEYRQTAQALLRQKDYQKAAFVYLKLLKDFPAAAEALEKGCYYAEAASVYLKYCKNSEKAAACYEKGSLINQAIELYIELNQDEKVGDLYCLINNKEVAFNYYEKVAQKHIRHQQYVKAALVYKNKMAALSKAQGVLLEGWRSGKDAFNCLSFYLSNIEDRLQRFHVLEAIRREDVHERNGIAFIQILKQEYEKGDELAIRVKDMAYELVVEQVAVNPSIATELTAFNKEDKQLMKDLLRFKVRQKKC